MNAECALKTCPGYLVPNHPKLREKNKRGNIPKTNAQLHHQSNLPVSHCGCSLTLHMERSAYSNFSDTYPLQYQRLVSESSPRRKVFDGVTVGRSLWHVSKAGSSQMRWLPVAWEAAGPCLQIWGCATNQVIALSRIHPLQLGRTPSTSCTPRWGAGSEGSSRGRLVQIIRHSQVTSRWSQTSPSSVRVPPHYWDLHPWVLKMCSTTSGLPNVWWVK